MRNLTTSPITDATGKVVQLVSATTGEQHEHITVSDLSKAVSDNLISSDSPNGIKKGTDGKLLVDPADLISTDAGNAIIEGTDGKLYRSATAVINDDQVLTGDTSTNTAVTLTPATVPDSAGGSQTNYTIKAEVKIDGVTITENASKQLVAADQTLNVLPTVQPTPTATGNTTNLNTTFKDASGTTWIVDKNGDAIIAGAAIFKEQKQVHVDKNGNNTTGTGADEAPYLTVQKGVDSALTADAVVVTEGTYAETVTMSVQNVTLRGEGNEYGGLTEINALNVTTASGTSNRVSSLTVLGNVSHTGGAPFYLSDVTINGNYASSSTAYDEIRGSRIQTGTISKTGAGILYITDSLIGNATFSTANSIISLDNVTIDAGDTVTIGAGVIYSLNDVRGHVAINPAAIPAETAALAGGLTGLAAKSVETATFNDVRLTNVPTITGATKALVRDTNGVVSEQVLTAQADINWTDVTTNPTATGNTGTLPRFTNNTVTGDKFFVGTNGVAVLVEKGTIITSFKPQNQNTAGTWADAQANSLLNVADAVLLSNGDRVKYGKYTFTGHGYAIGANLYLSKTLAGVVVTTNPLDGDVHQKIAFVHDANTIEFLCQEAFLQGSTASTVGANSGSASGVVARGVDVQLDNFKFRVAATGNMSLQVSTVSGSNNLIGTGVTMQSAIVVNSGALTATTTPAYVQSASNYSVGGATQTYTFQDQTTLKSYRATLIVGTGLTNNQITIERI